AERRERERTVGPALIADRRHPRLADRQLEMQRAEARDDLRDRRPCGQQARGARRRGRLHGRARPAEGGQEQGHDSDRDDHDEDCKAAKTTLPLEVAPLRRAGTPVCHRGRHAGHRSERLRAFQRGTRLGVPRPVPVRGPDKARNRGSIETMGTRIEFPRWVQLVGLPLLLVLAWVLASAAAHVVFLFVVAALLALLLDPLVRALQRARLPRGLSVAAVYVTFAAAL